MFAIIAYYLVVIIALIAMGDEIIEGEMKHMFQTINEKIPCAIILLIPRKNWKNSCLTDLTVMV